MIPNAWRGFDFALGEDADALRETVARFSNDQIAPRADEIDRQNEFPRDLWPKLGSRFVEDDPLLLSPESIPKPAGGSFILRVLRAGSVVAGLAALVFWVSREARDRRHNRHRSGRDDHILCADLRGRAVRARDLNGMSIH